MTIGMSTQTHAGEKKAPEPRKRTKQLPHQRSSSKEQGHIPPQALTGTPELCKLRIARGTSDKLGSHKIAS